MTEQEDFKLFLKDFMDWLNNQEVGLLKLRMQIFKLLEEKPKEKKPQFDFSQVTMQAIRKGAAP